MRRVAPHGDYEFSFDEDVDSEHLIECFKRLENLNFDSQEDSPFLGVTGGECGPGESNGVLLGRVTEGSAAEKMGLQSGDRVYKLDGEAVNSFDQLAQIIGSKSVGDNLNVEYKRGTESLKTNGNLGSRSELQSTQKAFRYNHGCDVGTGAGPWALDVIKEVSVIIEMKDCTQEEEDMLSAPAKVDFEEELALNRIEFSPNPNNGQFNLEFELPEKRNTRILVFDQMGRSIHEQSLSNFDGFYKDQIDISSQPNGIYFLIIAQDEKQFTRKIVKQ